jgi:3-methyladenine DNA glycosylase AlkD
MYKELLDEIISMKNDESIAILQRFFKTGKGQYGEGDLFLGIRVPELRKISKKYFDKINIDECEKLLKNKYHEIRLLSLFVFILKYEKENNKKIIFDIYLSNTRYINNWDLVDLSSPNIVGSYIYNNNLDKRILYDMIKTHDLWNTRIAILATFYFIKNEDYKDIIKMSEILIDDKRDLIHKALGWMLREVGKRDKTTLVKFLEKYSKKMPRTMLRYSIEKLSDEQKTIFMQK